MNQLILTEHFEKINLGVCNFTTVLLNSLKKRFRFSVIEQDVRAEKDLM